MLGRQCVDQAVDGLDCHAPLGPESQWVLNQELQRLAQVEESVRHVDQRFAEATQGDPLVEKLLALPGVALVTAVILRAMIGRFDRFRNGKQLSRFCGLTPCNASSGKRQADAGLVNEGNELLRAAMIQLAKRLPGHDAGKWKNCTRDSAPPSRPTWRRRPWRIAG